jgi:hypothetical protein
MRSTSLRPISDEPAGFQRIEVLQLVGATSLIVADK